MNTIKIYRPRAIFNLINGGIILALIFFFLTLPVLDTSEAIPEGKFLALIGFWIFGLVLTFAPFGFRLEVGQDYVRTYFLFFRLSDFDSSNILSVDYGNLFRGGLGFGKGLNIRLRSGTNKTYSIGENFYGKEALIHAKQVLEVGLK